MGEDSNRERERRVGLFDHFVNRTYTLSPGKEVRLSRDTWKCAVLWGPPVAKAAVIEVEMTKGTLESELPERTESPERS